MAITIRAGKKVEIVPPTITNATAKMMEASKKTNKHLSRARTKKVLIREAV